MRHAQSHGAACSGACVPATHLEGLRARGATQQHRLLLRRRRRRPAGGGGGVHRHLQLLLVLTMGLGPCGGRVDHACGPTARAPAQPTDGWLAGRCVELDRTDAAARGGAVARRHDGRGPSPSLRLVTGSRSSTTAVVWWCSHRRVAARASARQDCLLLVCASLCGGRWSFQRGYYIGGWQRVRTLRMQRPLGRCGMGRCYHTHRKNAQTGPLVWCTSAEVCA